MKTKPEIMYLLYVNTEKIEELFDQCYHGLVEVVKAKEKQKKLGIGVKFGLGKIIELMSPLRIEVEPRFEHLSLTSKETKRKLQGKPTLQLALVLSYLDNRNHIYHVSGRINRGQILEKPFMLIASGFECVLEPAEAFGRRGALPTRLGHFLSEEERKLIHSRIEGEVMLERQEPHAVIYSFVGDDALIVSSCNYKFLTKYGRWLHTPVPKRLYAIPIEWLTDRILAVDPIALWRELGKPQ